MRCITEDGILELSAFRMFVIINKYEDICKKVTEINWSIRFEKWKETISISGFFFWGVRGSTSERKDILRKSYTVMDKILPFFLLYGRIMARVSTPSMDLRSLYILHHRNVLF
jgi:hypothetical protein